jgi:hypothetical protein
MDQTVFNWLVALAGACGGWILKIIWDAIQDLKKDVRSMDTKMHEDFVRRDDFKDAMKHVQTDMAEMRSDMKDGFREVKELIGAVFKRLEAKADKSEK